MDIQQFNSIKTPLDSLFSHKLTENGDDALVTTGNNLLDIMFMTEYYRGHIDEALNKIGESDTERLFSMFIRDPRYGMGCRELGRALMFKTGVSPEDMFTAGRYDDFYAGGVAEGSFIQNFLDYVWAKVKEGDELAKKWMPRLNGKYDKTAKLICHALGISQKEYRKAIKCETVEKKMTEKRLCEINYEQVPSLSMVKHYAAFMKNDEERFQKYLESVKSGEKKLNVSTTTVYDIYRNRDTIDADLFFDKIEKISLSVCPILDTSGSMWDGNDSIGKAMAIAYYLAKCSTYANNQVVSFSSQPQLINIHEKTMATGKSFWYNTTFGNNNKFSRELNSMYTGDCSNTDFGAVIRLLSNLEEFPEYFVVLSDMEFDSGSKHNVQSVFRMFDANNVKSKIVWWNFNSRSTTVTIDKSEPRCIYMSGYSPVLLKYLNVGFDSIAFVNTLLTEYAKNIKKDL